MDLVMPFERITKKDISMVGGKNANLGEMINKTHVPVPGGFAVTSEAYQYFIKYNDLQPRLDAELKKIKDPNDTKALRVVGKRVRDLIMKGRMPPDLQKEIETRYGELCRKYGRDVFVAVRSSATAEDLPGASFAGQQETYLNVHGKKEVVDKVIECYSSLYTDRAIFYRIEKGFKHEGVSLSAAVQLMINSKAAGVMFSLDVRNGDTSKVIIEGAWGLGEYIVQGTVTPDDYFVDKRSRKIIERKISDKKVMLTRKAGGGNVELPVPDADRTKPVITDKQALELAAYSIALEDHYGHAQDTEWALDKDTNKIFILQTRPETAWSEKTKKKSGVAEGKEILKGFPASPGIGTGEVKIVLSLEELEKINNGDILVTTMTSPDMVPQMKKANAIVTDQGGTTCHAAIVSRELGIPCIVGTENATKLLHDGMRVTVDGSTGRVLEGIRALKTQREHGLVPKTKTRVYVNLGIPEIADKIAKKSCDGVGLMREEFILATYVKEHPLSLLKKGQGDVFVDKLAEGITKVAKAFNPRPVILRLSDFKTNEYKDLKGGEAFEPHEDNPMLGWRGCSRYIHPDYEAAFRLELKAVKKVREKYKNVHIMLPFPRAVWEVEKIEGIMASEGLKRGRDLKLWLMAEVPCNIFVADQFSKLCDGFSIGSNDLTQLILGVDRDSSILEKMGEFDERNDAVKRAISHLIKTAHKYGKTVSICGQAPSNYPDFTEFLIREGIDSVSINPDVFEKTKRIIADAEKRLK